MGAIGPVSQCERPGPISTDTEKRKSVDADLRKGGNTPLSLGDRHANAPKPAKRGSVGAHAEIERRSRREALGAIPSGH